VSDAGLPGVNDPGGRLVAAAVAEALPVTVLPGPSAVETSLVASGLLADEYRFVGYLPRRDAERRALAEELAGYGGSVVAFESPRRLAASLGVLAGSMPDRPAAVCRELTKRFEEVMHGTVAELAERFAEPPRGEITVVLGPRSRETDAVGTAEAEQAVAELVAAGVPRRQAVDVVARLTGASRNTLYRSSL
jgi:16S rRNA (cytidine1402-2'-O)-methyltransferase